MGRCPIFSSDFKKGSTESIRLHTLALTTLSAILSYFVLPDFFTFCVAAMVENEIQNYYHFGVTSGSYQMTEHIVGRPPYLP